MWKYKKPRKKEEGRIHPSGWNYPSAEGEDDGHSSYEDLSRATCCGGCQVSISPPRCVPCSGTCSHRSSSRVQLPKLLQHTLSPKSCGLAEV